MSWASIAQGAIKMVDKWLDDKNNKKIDQKTKAQIKNHKLDLKDVIYKTDHDVPYADLTALGHIRGFVVEKQGNLAKRKLIPLQIRDEGNAVYSASISKIDQCREKLLKAA